MRSTFNKNNLFLSFLFVANLSHGNTFEVNMGTELRYFPEPGLYSDEGARVALKLEATHTREIFSEGTSFNLHSRVRYDFHDSDRTDVDFPALNVSVFQDSWDLTVGMDKVFWGVTESQNIVNVVNQIDYLESPDGKEKLGQLMVRYAVNSNWGTVDFFVLPGFREREYGSEDGRLTLHFLAKDAIYESSSKKEHIDVALRWRHYVGEFNFAISYFDGTNRMPYFSLATENNPGAENFSAFFNPVYDQMSQWGFEGQYIYEEYLFKAEVIDQHNSLDHFLATTVGVEYTLGQVFDTSKDLSFYAEYLYDQRGANALPGVFENDVMVAARLSFNNEASSSFLMAYFWDDRTYESSLKVEGNYRFTDNLAIGIEAWTFNADPSYSKDIMTRMFELAGINGKSKHAFLNDEDFIALELTYYF